MGMMWWSPSKLVPDAEIERVVRFPVSHIIDGDDRNFKQVSYSKELPEHQLAHNYNQLGWSSSTVSSNGYDSARFSLVAT